MECRQLNENVIDRLTGEISAEAGQDLAAHLDACGDCRAEASAIERAWAFLGEDGGAEPTPEFLRRGKELLEEEMLRQRVREFQPRTRWVRPALQAAAVLAAAGLGYLAAARRTPPPASSSPRLGPTPAPAIAGLGQNSRLSNLSYQGTGPNGRIGIGFDVTTRHTIEGSPADPEVSKMLAYVVGHNTENAGEKARAIELVQQHYGQGEAAPSPDIVAALTATLKHDPNPGVRKKAADALAGMRMTPEIRTAFLDALRADGNPAVRLVAIDRLAAAAKDEPDARTIQSLREKAVDPSENGFVRAKAASALKTMEF